MSAVGRADVPAVAGVQQARMAEVSQLRVVLTGSTIDVVDDVSFALSAGETLGLVGESGSGKTTVALALLGYARTGTSIAGGSVSIDGRDVLTLPPEKLRLLRGKVVSYVPQDPSSWLNPSLRIGSQLSEMLAEHDVATDDGARRQRVVEMMAEVSLPAEPAFLSRYPHQLSGGQQQRVALAMAFACRPAVVVLDEPTTGLDVTTQAHVLRTVNDLTRVHHTAAVYVSHDLAVVAGLATRIAVMYAGRVVEEGLAAEVLHMPGHPYTRRLLAAIPDPNRRHSLVGIPGRVAPLGPRGPGCSFADRCEFVEDACRTQPIIQRPVSSVGLHSVRCRRSDYVRSLSPQEITVPPTSESKASGASAPWLEVEGINARYGANQVLFGVGFTVGRGRCLALVGESGSGKTTLAKCIAGMHAQGSGDIRVDGQSLAWSARGRTSDERQAVQYIFQNPYSSLNPRKSVRALLEQPLKHFGLLPDDDPVPQLLEQVSLAPSYANRYPAQLSGGERQRIAIARALAVSPSVLICDEITSSLDVSVQASILALLARLHADTSLTVLFVTHNLAVVRAIADSVLVLETGVIVEEGSVDTVLDAPEHPYTQTLLRDTPGIE